MKSKVVAVLKAPFRLLAALLRLLGKGLAKLGRIAKRGGPGKHETPANVGAAAATLRLTKTGKPAKSGRLARLGRLDGKPLVALFVALAVVAVAAVLVLKPAGADDDKAVRDSLARFAKATSEKDYQTLCDELFARALVETIRSAGLPCEVALKTGLDSRRNLQFAVIAVEVNGEQALARTRSSAVGEPRALETLRLVRENGSWRIASQPDAQSGAPAP